jgi:hypothetical protein
MVADIFGTWRIDHVDVRNLVRGILNGDCRIRDGWFGSGFDSILWWRTCWFGVRVAMDCWVGGLDNTVVFIILGWIVLETVRSWTIVEPWLMLEIRWWLWMGCTSGVIEGERTNVFT